MDNRTRTRIRDLLFEFSFSPAQTNELHELLRGLTEITFYSNDNIRPYGVVRLAEALQNPYSTVTTLNLVDILLGNSEYSGVEAIANALKSPNCKLKSLNLTRINDDEASLIANALQSPHCKLTRLALTSQIGDNGAIAIADALKSPNCRLILLHIDQNPYIQEEGINAIANALKVNMTLTSFRPSSFDTSKEVPLNRMIKNLFFTFFVQENAQKGFGSDVVKNDLIPHLRENNFNNDAWNNLYWEEMKNISSLSRFVNYLDTSDPINVKIKIKRRILFLKRNKIINHVPAQLNERVQNALYNNDVQQQQINRIGRAIYDIQLRLNQLSKQQMQIQTKPSSHHQSSSSSSSSKKRTFSEMDQP